MAKNKGGSRMGFIADRWQYQLDDGTWIKVDSEGNILGAKRGAPFKNIRKR